MCMFSSKKLKKNNHFPEEQEYRDLTINRINSKYSCEIVYIQNINDINSYLEKHPNKTKIGFLVKAPAYLNSPNDYSPIYFEYDQKNKNNISFNLIPPGQYLMFYPSQI